MSALPTAPSARRVVVVGAGLAGMAAAAALAQRGCQVELLEARRKLGGRTSSFADPESGHQIDQCQHVGMGCCTNWLAFCRQLGIESLLRRERSIGFYWDTGRSAQLAAWRGWPAPLHLLPSFLRLGLLSWKERLGVARALLRLARYREHDLPDGPSMAEFLRQAQQSPQAIERFWQPVLVSALGDTLERVGVPLARKVFVDGFMAHRHGYELFVPTCSLDALYGVHVQAALSRAGVRIHTQSEVVRLLANPTSATGVALRDGRELVAEGIVLALPWRKTAGLLDHSAIDALRPIAEAAREIEGSPISAVHLWFDRPVIPVAQAVLVDTLSQWVFCRHSAGETPTNATKDNETEGDEAAQHGGHYVQVVISASHTLADRQRGAIVDEVCRDLARHWPQVAEATLLRWRLVTENEAVFSVRPGVESLRPSAATALTNLALAGDWTATGWPATMEGAVRSGYLAAETLLAAWQRPEPILHPELARGWLARWLLGRS